MQRSGPSYDSSDDGVPASGLAAADLGWADGGAEDESQAIDMARREIEAVLQDTESLDKVASLKKNYARVRGHLDSQIMRILQSKIDESEDWVSLFKQSVQHINQIEKNFAEIEAECEVCARRVKQWETIKTFNRARNNVTSSLGELQLLRSLPDDIEELVRDMDDEESRDEGLLDIHVRLTKLEETRARVISKHLRRELVLPDTHHLVRSFETVHDIVQGFEDIMSDNMKHAIDLAQEAPAVLVRILRVIERQERIDRWWRQDAAKERRALADLQSRGQAPAEMGTQRGYSPKGWRDKAKGWMQSGVEERFQPLMLDMHEGEGDVSQATIEKLSKLRDDFVILYDEVAPCFPPSYHIFSFYVQYYHVKFELCFKALLEKASTGNVPAGQSLNLMNWIDDYREALQAVGMPEPPSPSLASLTAFEGPLLASHERMFSQNIDTLAKRILADDWADMRVEEDDTSDHHTMYTTPAPSLFFRLLQTSSTMAFDLPRTKYALQMAYLVGHAIGKFQDMLNDRIDDFNQRFVIAGEELPLPKAAQSSEENSDEDDGQTTALNQAREDARADAWEQLKHFSFAWMNNCQDLHDFTVNLQDYLNRSLFMMHEREVAAEELAAQHGGLARLTSAPLGSPRASRVDFEDTAAEFLRSGTQLATHVTQLLWKRELEPLCEQLLEPGDSEHEVRADDVIYVLSDMLTNDLRYRVGHTYSERLGKDLLQLFFLAYFDRLLGKEARVKYAKRTAEGESSSILEQDLYAVQDFYDAVAAHGGADRADLSDDGGGRDGEAGLGTDARGERSDTSSDDEPSISRVVYALGRLVKIWEYMFAMLTMEPTVEGLFLGFQNICSRDTSCPTKLCELILLRRDDCKKDLRNKIKGMMRERVVEYKSSGILCNLKSVQNIDDVLRRDAEKAAAEASAANKKSWKKMGARVKIGVAMAK